MTAAMENTRILLETTSTLQLVKLQDGQSNLL